MTQQYGRAQQGHVTVQMVGGQAEILSGRGRPRVTHWNVLRGHEMVPQNAAGLLGHASHSQFVADLWERAAVLVTFAVSILAANLVRGK